MIYEKASSSDGEYMVNTDSLSTPLSRTLDDQMNQNIDYYDNSEEQSFLIL